MFQPQAPSTLLLQVPPLSFPSCIKVDPSAFKVQAHQLTCFFLYHLHQSLRRFLHKFHALKGATSPQALVITARVRHALNDASTSNFPSQPATYISSILGHQFFLFEVLGR